MQEFPNSSGNFCLSAKKELAIIELLSPENKTLKDVATKLGISERTLRGWLKTDSFQTRLQEERKRLRDEAFNKLKSTLARAVERLGELLDSDSESIKLRACQAILDYNIKIVENQELEERLRVLEEALEQQKNRGRF